MTLTLTFPGFNPMAKARPRLGQGFVHMPKPYVDWKYAFAARAKWQYNGDPINEPIRVAVVWNTLSGNMRPDLDNAFGAVADALQEAEVIGNDGQVRAIVAMVQKAKKNELGIVVTIDVIEKAASVPRKSRNVSVGNPTALG